MVARRRPRDDEPDDEPRRSRRSRDDDEPRGRRSRRDEDDEPRRGRRAPSGDDYRGRDDDDGDEPDDEPRRGRGRRSRDDDDEPRGRGRGRGRSRDDEDEDDRPRRSRRSRDDEDEDDRPRRSRRDRDEEEKERRNLRESAVGEGWESYKKNRERSWQAPEEFTTPNKDKKEESAVITFLDNKPFASFNQHWIERKGKKSFTCLGEDCPLCDILGDRPTTYACFNIVDMTGERDPMVKVWMVRKTVANSLKALNEDDKTGPLTERYYSVHRTGKGGSTNTSINPIKERDLEEDWEIEPLTDEEWDDLEKDAYNKDVISVQSRKTLQEVAEEEAGL